MNYYNSNKKTVIGLVLIVVIVTLPLMFYILSRDAPEEVGNALEESSEAKRVFIKDLHNLEESIDQNTQRRIENELYTQTSDGVPDLYTGIIRQDSYSNILSGKVTTINFLVDVRPVNISYRVTVVVIRENSSVTVACAPHEQQIDHSATCEDSEYI